MKLFKGISRAIFSLLVFASVFLSGLAVVNAQYYGFGGGGWTPSQLLENEWAVFVIFFAIFFSTIFYSLGRVMKDNPVPPAVIALALAFFVSAGIQRNWYFLERSILFWALVLTGLLVLVTFFRAFKEKGGIGALLAALVGAWAAWPWISSSDFGYELKYNMPLWLSRGMDNTAWLAWVILVIIVIMTFWRSRDRIVYAH